MVVTCASWQSSDGIDRYGEDVSNERPDVTIADGVVRLPDAPGARESSDCMSCGSHLARPWSTPEGRAWLCRECATLHGIGCP